MNGDTRMLKTSTKKTVKIYSGRLSVREQARCARRLATFLSAGISLPEGIAYIGRSMAPSKKALFESIAAQLSKGQTCSESFPERVFDRSFICMAKIGEESGSLEEAFSHAATMLEKRDLLSKKIIGALIYPAFVICVTLGMAGFLVTYIFPKIIPLITSMDIPLPFLTRMLMGVSDVLVHHSVTLIFALLCLSFSVFFLWKKIPSLRKKILRGWASMPLVGGIMMAHIIVSIFRPLGLLLERGEMLPKALVSVGGMIRWEEYCIFLSRAERAIIRGGSFAQIISVSSGGRSIFPSLVTDMIETGERTGGIGQACGHIASIYEADVDESIKHISQIIEPVLMLGMGFVVGSIALSIVLPIYEITNHLTK